MPTEDQNIPSEVTPGAVPSEPTPEPTPQPSDSVSLNKQEYAALMTELAMLKNQIESVSAAPQTPTPPPSYANKSLNEFTNEELVHMISTQTGQQQQQLLNTIMQLAVSNEVRDLGDKHEDFKTSAAVRDEVLNIAEKNSHLSLEQAYFIYKGMNPKVATAQTQTPTQTQTQTPTPPPGERPSVASQAVQQDKPMSTREAAEAAFKALKYEN